MSFWCHHLDQNTNEIFSKISALASKKRLNQKLSLDKSYELNMRHICRKWGFWKVVQNIWNTSILWFRDYEFLNIFLSFILCNFSVQTLQYLLCFCPQRVEKTIPKSYIPMVIGRLQLWLPKTAHNFISILWIISSNHLW